MTTQLPDQWTDPTADPAAANATVEAALKPSSSELPTIELPADDLVDLPGGLKVGEKIYRTAKVRELTGADEEALAKAMQSSNPFHFIDTLLECGTATVGEEPESNTQRFLKELLIGDRDALILGIRNATYGPTIDYEEFVCPECQGTTDLNIPLSEIEVKKLEDPEKELEFEVELRKGKKALVRLPNGEDQGRVYEKAGLTSAARDTILLSRCVLELVDPDGTTHSLLAFPSLARDMGLADRKKILKELAERQPGPRFNEVKFTHEECGNEVTLTVTVGDLFLDF